MRYVLANPKEGVTAVAPGVAACASADSALGDLAVDVVLLAVGVQRYLGMVEHPEQLGFTGVQLLEQAI